MIKFVLHTHTVTHGHKPDIKPCRTPKTLTTKTFTSRREQGKKTKNTHSAFSSHSPNHPPPITPTQWYTEENAELWSASELRQGARERWLYRAIKSNLFFQESRDECLCGSGLVQTDWGIVWSTQTRTKQQAFFFLFSISVTRLVHSSAATLMPAPEKDHLWGREETLICSVFVSTWARMRSSWQSPHLKFALNKKNKTKNFSITWQYRLFMSNASVYD